MVSRKLLAFIILFAGILTPTITFAQFTTVQGGTGTTSPSGILYGDSTLHLKSLGIGAGCTLVGSTLTCSGTGAGYPFPLTGNATGTLTQFNGGLTAYASSTIGAGGVTTGLTINGTATTTQLIDTGLSNGNCVQASTNGLLTTTGSACGTATFSGTIGQVNYFSGTNTAVGTSTILITAASFVGIATGANQSAAVGSTNPNYKFLVTNDYGDTSQFLLGVGSSTSSGVAPTHTDYFEVSPLGPVIVNTTMQVGGNDNRGVLTVQKSSTQAFVANTDPTDSGRYFVMENTQTDNAIGEYANITLQINPNGGLPGGRVLSDIRAIRQAANSSDMAFLFSAFNNAGSYRDYAQIASTTNWFLGNLKVGGSGAATGGTVLDVAGFINTDQYSGYKQAANTILYASSTNFATLVGIGAGTGLNASSTVTQDTAVGYQALNTTPTNGSSPGQNTAIGYQTMKLLTTGNNNVGVGSGVMSAGIVTGQFNVAIGINSLQNVTSGSTNFAMGANTLASVTGGSNNVAIGDAVVSQGGATGITATVGIGYHALFKTTGNNNTAIGYNTGDNNTSGAGNLLLGASVGTTLTGSNNILLGAFVEPPVAGNNNQLDIGNILYGTGLYNTAAQSSAPVTNGNIGVGSSTPFAQLAVHAVAGSTNTTLFAIGSSTATATTTLFSVSNTGAILTVLANGCVQAASGILTSTGSACGSGGGGTFPFTPTTVGNSTSTLLQLNGGASTTLLSVFTEGSFGGTSTTTIFGNGATSTFKGSVAISTTSPTAFSVQDQYGTSVFNTNTASTTGDILDVASSTGTNYFTVNQSGLVSTLNASTTLFSAFTKSYFGATATATIDSAGNEVIPSGSNLTITGKSDGCATFATGQLNSTGSACGSGGGGTFPFTSFANYNATSTSIGFLQGLFSNSSTTLNGTIQFPSLAAGTTNIGPVGNVYTTATTSVTSGTGISLSANPGALIGGSNLTITNSGVTSIVAGTNITISGATGAVTINSSGGGGGTYPFTPSTDGSINTSATSTPIQGNKPGLGLDVSNTSWYGIGGALLAYASSTNQDTIFGLNAGGNNATTSATAKSNSIFGYLSGTSLTTGANETFIGYQTGLGVSTASSNTAVGSNAMATVGILQTGNGNNTAIGYSAAVNLGGTTGGVTVVGAGSLGASGLTGSSNTILGAGTAGNITSGASDIVIGAGVQSSSASISNLLNIGNVIYGTGIFGNFLSPTSAPNLNGSIGIGTSSPFAKFSISLNNLDTGVGIFNNAFVVASSTATATTTLFKITNTGHTVASSTSPALSSCGTTPSMIGDDTHGEVTVGSVAATGCTVTFANAWTVAPICTLSNQSMSITSALTYSITTTALTFSQATGLIGDKVDYICEGLTGQ